VGFRETLSSITEELKAELAQNSIESAVQKGQLMTIRNHRQKRLARQALRRCGDHCPRDIRTHDQSRRSNERQGHPCGFAGSGSKVKDVITGADFGGI